MAHQQQLNEYDTGPHFEVDDIQPLTITISSDQSEDTAGIPKPALPFDLGNVPMSPHEPAAVADAAVADAGNGISAESLLIIKEEGEIAFVAEGPLAAGQFAEDPLATDQFAEDPFAASQFAEDPLAVVDQFGANAFEDPLAASQYNADGFAEPLEAAAFAGQCDGDDAAVANNNNDGAVDDPMEVELDYMTTAQHWCDLGKRPDFVDNIRALLDDLLSTGRLVEPRFLEVAEIFRPLLTDWFSGTEAFANFMPAPITSFEEAFESMFDAENSAGQLLIGWLGTLAVYRPTSNSILTKAVRKHYGLRPTSWFKKHGIKTFQQCWLDYIKENYEQGGAKKQQSPKALAAASGLASVETTSPEKPSEAADAAAENPASSSARKTRASSRATTASVDSLRTSDDSPELEAGSNVEVLKASNSKKEPRSDSRSKDVAGPTKFPSVLAAELPRTERKVRLFARECEQPYSGTIYKRAYMQIEGAGKFGKVPELFKSEDWLEELFSAGDAGRIFTVGQVETLTGEPLEFEIKPRADRRSVASSSTSKRGRKRRAKSPSPSPVKSPSASPPPEQKSPQPGSSSAAFIVPPSKQSKPAAEKPRRGQVAAKSSKDPTPISPQPASAQYFEDIVAALPPDERLLWYKRDGVRPLLPHDHMTHLSKPGELMHKRVHECLPTHKQRVPEAVPLVGYDPLPPLARKDAKLFEPTTDFTAIPKPSFQEFLDTGCFPSSAAINHHTCLTFTPFEISLAYLTIVHFLDKRRLVLGDIGRFEPMGRFGCPADKRHLYLAPGEPLHAICEQTGEKKYLPPGCAIAACLTLPADINQTNVRFFDRCSETGAAVFQLPDLMMTGLSKLWDITTKKPFDWLSCKAPTWKVSLSEQEDIGKISVVTGFCTDNYENHTIGDLREAFYGEQAKPQISSFDMKGKTVSECVRFVCDRFVENRNAPGLSFDNGALIQEEQGLFAFDFDNCDSGAKLIPLSHPSRNQRRNFASLGSHFATGWRCGMPGFCTNGLVHSGDWVLLTISRNYRHLVRDFVAENRKESKICEAYAHHGNLKINPRDLRAAGVPVGYSLCPAGSLVCVSADTLFMFYSLTAGVVELWSTMLPELLAYKIFKMPVCTCEDTGDGFKDYQQVYDLAREKLWSFDDDSLPTSSIFVCGLHHKAKIHDRKTFKNHKLELHLDENTQKRLGRYL